MKMYKLVLDVMLSGPVGGYQQFEKLSAFIFRPGGSMFLQILVHTALEPRRLIWTHFVDAGRLLSIFSFK
jgi:hypothetical protein